MRKVLLVLLSLVLLTSICLPAIAEDNGKLKAMKDQIEDSMKKLKKYKFALTYEFKPDTSSDLQFVLGLCAKLQILFDEKGKTDWKKKIKGVKGINVHVTKPEDYKEKRAYNIQEEESRKVISYNPQKSDPETLMIDLCEEKTAYFELSKLAKKIGLNIIMGEGMAWSDAAVLIRKFKTVVDEERSLKKVLKKLTIRADKEENGVPDFSKNIVPVVYNIEKELLIHNLGIFDEESDAYDSSAKIIDSLKKMGVTITVHQKFKETFFEAMWRKSLPLLQEMKKLTSVEVTLGKMMKKPIVLSPGSTEETDKEYVISVYDDPSILANFFKI